MRIEIERSRALRSCARGSPARPPSVFQGFVSANIHKSLDGTRVVNYAQWRSKDDFEAMVKSPEVAPHMKAAGPIAKFEPHLYAVAAVHTV